MSMARRRQGAGRWVHGWLLLLLVLLLLLLHQPLSAGAVNNTRSGHRGCCHPLCVPDGVCACVIVRGCLLQVVDSGLHEDKRFMRYLVGVLVLLYFGLVKLMYR